MLLQFHGATSLEDANEAIRGQPKGCFLVRVGQGIASGSLSVSRVTDPMTVLHSRLYYNAETQHWALKTRKTQKDVNTLHSPRLTADAVTSMVRDDEKFDLLSLILTNSLTQGRSS